MRRTAFGVNLRPACRTALCSGTRQRPAAWWSRPALRAATTTCGSRAAPRSWQPTRRCWATHTVCPETQPRNPPRARCRCGLSEPQKAWTRRPGRSSGQRTAHAKQKKRATNKAQANGNGDINQTLHSLPTHHQVLSNNQALRWLVKDACKNCAHHGMQPHAPRKFRVGQAESRRKARAVLSRYGAQGQCQRIHHRVLNCRSHRPGP